MKDNRAWALAYWDYMMKEDFEAMLDIKMQHFPESFFKYKRLDKYTIENLRNDVIWLADISTLNDPFECSLQFDNDECLRVFYADKKFQKTFEEKFGFKLSKKEISKITSSPNPYLTYTGVCRAKNIVMNVSPDKQLETVQKRFAKILDETNKNIRVTCFTEHYDSLLMWAHYADQHQGICLEYDFLDEHDIRAFLQPIIYDQKIHKIGLLEEITMLSTIGSSIIKSMEWQYEAEWRLTIFKQQKEFPNNIKIPIPKAVYLGTRFAKNGENEQKEFLDLMKEKNIPVYQMVKHPTEYRLEKSLYSE